MKREKLCAGSGSPGTCAQLPPKSGAVQVDAVDVAPMVLAAATAVLLIVSCNRISLSIGIEALRFVVPVVTGGPCLLLSTSGIMKVVNLC